VKVLAGVLAVGFAAGSLDAQVGYPPAASPFRDLLYKQDVTLFSGYFAAGNDPVGVAPQAGPMVGVRYEVRIGGPAQFFTRAGRVFSERTIINPTLAAGERDIGTTSVPLYVIDLGISFNLTGQKSYRGFVPVVTFGGGIASDFSSQRDVGDYRFGTPFALSLGGGVRYVTDGPFQLRLDLVDYLYQIRYPSSYFVSTGSAEPVRRGDQSAWTHNRAITVGASYQFFR
jgi:hypothetical protein